MTNRSRTVTPAPQPLRVVVVGGGAAGAIVATHLLRAATTETPVDVRVVEPERAVGPGLAYRTAHWLHTLNNFAGRLSALDDDPDHLLRWCAERGLPVHPQSFLPRNLYGTYLADVVDQTPVPTGSSFRRNRGQVVDVVARGNEFDVALSDNWQVRADRVVMALGNPPPRRRPDLEALGSRYLPDPWACDLTERVGQADRVLLLGTGLTMVDVASQIHEANPTVEITAVSRHGLLPAPHVRGSLRPHDGYHPGTTTLTRLMSDVRRRIGEVEEVGGSWRDVVDSIRMYADDLWHSLSEQDQERFVRHVARRWDVVRHRMAPAMAEHICALRENGTLLLAGHDEVEPGSFDRVVNCTGPAPAHTPGWNPLVDRMTVRGSIRANRLGLGLDVDGHGQVIDAAGSTTPGLFAVGAARRGVAWEVAAIPDIRRQAARLAGLLLAHGQAAPTQGSPWGSASLATASPTG